MNHPDSEDLLNNILDAENHAEFRQQTLARGLAEVRARARRRHFARMGVAAAIPCLLALGLLLSNLHDRTQTASRTALHNDSPPRVNDLPPIKIINDEQLFALFPGRAMALIGSPGNQQLVFLDRPAAAPSN